MNTSLFTADRDTHIKIVVVALVAAFMVMLVGVTARVPDANSLAARRHGETLVVKAAQPARFSNSDAAAVR